MSFSQLEWKSTHQPIFYMSWSQRLAYVFTSSLGATLLLYFLRAFKVITSFPGGIILVLAVLSIASGLIYGVLKTKRY
jgi:hypothetical protein